MAKLKISTLGPLQITTEPPSLHNFLSDKVRGLLVYLAVEQARAFRREALAALFWPGQPKAKARANLRRALANLRQAIDDEKGRFLHITRQTLQFNGASPAFVDACKFWHLLNDHKPGLPQMEEAVALANGRFLEGFSIKDSIAFEEWALLKREAIQRQLLQTLNRLTAYYEAHHQPESAIVYAQQQVDIEPWYEPGQRQLLRLLDQTDQRAAALVHYEQFQQALLAELGVRPEAATRELVEAIRAAPAQAKRVSLPDFLVEPQAPPATPFVAREAELEKLYQCLKTAVSSQLQTVFVTGEAGSGKTSLLQTFAQKAQKQTPELIPLLGNCRAHIGPGSPYLPFRNLLAQALDDIETLWRSGAFNRAQVQRLWQLRQTTLALLQEVAPDCLAALVDDSLLPKTTAPQPPTQEQLFQQLAHFLQKLSQHGPLLLLLDDLHWADSGSIDLLFHLRQQLAGYPVLLVGTYRPEELISQGTRERHPLMRLVHELGHDFGDIVVALNHSDGRLFVDTWLDTEPNQVGDSFRQALFAQTKGHALFTVELVTNLQERGVLHRDAQGYWQADAAVKLAHLPAKTEAIIAERIGRLPPFLRQLLAAASIQGETFAAEPLAEILQRPFAEIIPPLSAELARGHRLLQVQGRQHIGQQNISLYRFRHSLFQQYIYHRLDPIERAQLHQATARALIDLYENANVDLSSVAAELAYHFASAQAVPQALHYRQLAGDHALRLSAQAEAIHHYRQGLALLTSQPETPNRIKQEINIRLALGAALLAVKGYSAREVKAVYDRTFSLCNRVDAFPEMVTTLFWLTSYYAVSGDLAKAVTVSQQMLAVAEQETVSDMHQMQAHVLAGLPLFFMGRNTEALDHFIQASAMYDPEKHQPLIYTLGQDPGIASMMWQGHVYLHMGLMADANRCLSQALTWAAALDHPYTQTFTYFLAGCTPNIWYVSNFAAAFAHGQKAQKLAQDGNFAQMLALTNFYLGQITAVTHLAQNGREAQKKAAEGFAMMQQGLEMEAAIGSKLGLSSRYLLLADTHRQAGQIDQAWHYLRMAEIEANSRQELYFAAEIFRIKGELHFLAGEEAQAESSWRQAVHIARQQEAKTWELRSGNALNRLRQNQRTGSPEG